MPPTPAELLDAVLRAVVAVNRTATLTLVLDDAGQWDPVAVETGRSIDHALRELRHRGWIVGHDQGGDGSVFFWSQMAVAVEGLRHLGEWPPGGQQFLPGPWDDGLWGDVAKPVLADLASSPPGGGYVLRPWDPDEIQRWAATLLLLDAGLIDGTPDDEGISDVRVTTAGAIALDPPDDDPLVRARLKLRQGAKADAVTAAIDEALKPQLHSLAETMNVPVVTTKGAPMRLANLNDQLRGVAYGHAQHDYVSAWLHDRNEVDHGRGAEVPDRRIELMLDGIELLVRNTEA